MIQIISDLHTSRLNYVLDFVFNQVLKTGFVLCHEHENLSSFPVLYYSEKNEDNRLTFIPSEIIKDSKSIHQQSMEDILQALQSWLTTEERLEKLDIFGVIFCYLSRYEEYFEYSTDQWGRFLSKHSRFHSISPDEPVVDKMISALKSIILQNFPNYLFPDISGYNIISTIDIDQAWAYQNKGWRNFLSISKTIIKGKFSETLRIINVLRGHEVDPFDTYQYISNVHKASALVPLYFILLSDELTSIDRNHQPSNLHFQKLLYNLSIKNHVGIHPSYHSQGSELILLDELNTLKSIIGQDVTASRQHFLIMKLPNTYRTLLNVGITDDYTMGFADNTGYRAGTGHPFFWYDLYNEAVTQLKIHPFQVMDATLKRYLKLNPTEASKRIDNLKVIALKHGSPFTILWHNSSLDEAGEWKGWRQVYESALKK